jgi:hypothetical protein
MSLKSLVCRGIGWNFYEFDADITWRMLSGDYLNRYIGVPITNDISFNTIVGLISTNEL